MSCKSSRQSLTVSSCLEQRLLPELHLICKINAGVEDMPFDVLKEYGIRLTNTAKATSSTTADLALSLLLAAGRQLLKGARIATTSEYRSKFSQTDLGMDISNSTLGIVGMGEIGYKVAKRAKAFNMKILYHNRRQRSGDDEKVVGARYYPSLQELLPHCDYVMICCPYTPQTEKLFKLDQFKSMKQTAYLINMARGAIVDTEALVEALDRGLIAGAALDVTKPEPLPRDHPLLKMEDKVIVLPHWGIWTSQGYSRMLQMTIENVKAWYSNQPLQSEVTL